MPQIILPKRLRWTLLPLIPFLTSADRLTNQEGSLCQHVEFPSFFQSSSFLSDSVPKLVALSRVLGFSWDSGLLPDPEDPGEASRETDADQAMGPPHCRGESKGP